MMGNPLQAMVQMMSMGKDPMQFLQQMAGNNPQVAQFMQMINGKSPQQLQEIAVNMAKERGTTVQNIANQLGIPAFGKR